MPLTAKAAPTRTKLRHDKEDPIVKKSKIEIDAPNLAQLRKDKDAPKDTKSKIDIVEPSRACPKIASSDPKRLTVLSDNDDPKWR